MKERNFYLFWWGWSGNGRWGVLAESEEEALSFAHIFFGNIPNGLLHVISKSGQGLLYIQFGEQLPFGEQTL